MAVYRKLGNKRLRVEREAEVRSRILLFLFGFLYSLHTQAYRRYDLGSPGA